MTSAALPPPALAPPLPAAAAPPAGGFSIQASPFAATGTREADARLLAAAFAAATQPVGAALKRPRPADEEPPAPPPPRQWAGGKSRPPRPPSSSAAGGEGGGGGGVPPALDLALVQQQQAQQQLPRSSSPRQAARSPRSPAGGASPGGRRPKQLSKTAGRVCIECGTSSTTQWRSQGLLCNSCGVKLIKGRLPMDAESMHRRFLRLPNAIRHHPMWEAAQVVASAQAHVASAAAAGRPWACPGCHREGQERVAGPCGLQQCPSCVARYHPPLTGAAAVAAVVAAPRASTPSPTRTPPASGGGGASAQKRRKQSAPRSAADGLSPRSGDSSGSGSSSVQAYSFQGGREDDATSKEQSPNTRATSRRLRQVPARHRTDTPPAPAAGQQAGRAVTDTPAAEAAAALLVLTESDELRMMAAFDLNSLSAQKPLPAAAPAPAPAAAKAAERAAALAAAEAAEAAGAMASTPPDTPAQTQDAGGAPGELPAGAARGSISKPAAERALGGALQAPGFAPPLPVAAAAPAAAPAAPAAMPAASGVADALRLYQLLIAACGTPEAAAAGLSAELVGRYLAAHTQPSQSFAAAGGAASSQAAAAIASQQAQQARLVVAMCCEGQLGAAVSLMRGVIKLSGLDG